MTQSEINLLVFFSLMIIVGLVGIYLVYRHDKKGQAH
jgi:hypothetical protein